LIEGDGIGPEIAVAVKDIFAAAKVCAISFRPAGRYWSDGPLTQ